MKPRENFNLKEGIEALLYSSANYVALPYNVTNRKLTIK